MTNPRMTCSADMTARAASGERKHSRRPVEGVFEGRIHQPAAVQPVCPWFGAVDAKRLAFECTPADRFVIVIQRESQRISAGWRRDARSDRRVLHWLDAAQPTELLADEFCDGLFRVARERQGLRLVDDRRPYFRDCRQESRLAGEMAIAPSPRRSKISRHTNCWIMLDHCSQRVNLPSSAGWRAPLRLCGLLRPHCLLSGNWTAW